MDFGFVSSPSPSQSLFTAGQYFDSTSESSSPNSPHVSTDSLSTYKVSPLTRLDQMSQMMFHSAPMQYGTYQYGTTSASFYPQSQTTKMPIDYNSSAIDPNDRRRRRSDSISTPEAKDKETVPNMHLVSSFLFFAQGAALTDSAKATPCSKSRVTASFSRKERKTRQGSRAPTRRPP